MALKRTRERFGGIIGVGGSPAPTVPLLLNLHGGGGSRDDLVRNYERGEYDRRLEQDGAPPMVVATISAQNSFYSDYHDGSQRWETFVFEEFIPFVETTYRCGGPGAGGFRFLPD